MMNTKSKSIWYYYEKFKAFLLVFLMILCVVQVGILWRGQSGSIPFFNSKTPSQTSIDDLKCNYLLPYRVIISTGFDNDHYIIPNGSEEYTTLWNGAKLYLTQALDTKPKQTQVFSEDKWGTLVANKPYTFEFKTQIPIDIIKWVLNSKGSAGEGLSNIYKVVICPDDPDNNYSDTLYIRDDKNIYTYDVPNFNGNALSKEEIKSTYIKLQSNTKSKDYQMAIETFRNDPISQDMLAPFTQNSTEWYTNLTCAPVVSSDGQAYKMADYNLIATELFGEASKDYEPDEDVNGSAVFKKVDSVFRLYKNSVLEYKYTENQGTTEKLKVLDAYKNAIAFIAEQSRQSNFMSGISVYLKSIEEEQNSYVFDFDYSVSLGGGNGEIPILIKGYKIPTSNKLINSSISIEATSKRVIRCDWLALKFKVNKAIEKYEWNFADTHIQVINSYTELKNKEPYVKDLAFYYVLSYSEKYDHLITPSFVLFTKDGSYDIPMKGNNNK